jgi:hypothetical protein
MSEIHVTTKQMDEAREWARLRLILNNQNEFDKLVGEELEKIVIRDSSNEFNYIEIKYE